MESVRCKKRTEFPFFFGEMPLEWREMTHVVRREMY